MEHKSSERILSCVAFGRVLPVGEISGSPYAKRAEGDGFAVIPKTGLWRFVAPKNAGILCSPTDGTVTENDEGRRITLRTGDGVTLSVIVGESASLSAQTGDKLSRGEPLGTLSGSEPAYVLFTEPEQITELHISSGLRRSGSVAAVYRVRRSDS